MYFGTNSIFATLNIAKYSVYPTEKNLVINYMIFSKIREYALCLIYNSIYLLFSSLILHINEE